MKRKKKLYRIISFILSLAILVNGFFFNTVKADASALAGELSAELLSEIFYLRLRALETQLVASGNASGFTTVDDGLNLLDSYSKYEAQLYNNADDAGKQIIEEAANIFTLNWEGTIYKVKCLPTVWKITNTASNTTYDYNPYTSEYKVDNSFKTILTNKLNEAATNSAFVAMTGVSLVSSLYRSLSGFLTSAVNTSVTDRAIILGSDADKYDISEYFDVGFNAYIYCGPDRYGAYYKVDGSEDSIIISQSDRFLYALCAQPTAPDSYHGYRYDASNDSVSRFNLGYVWEYSKNFWWNWTKSSQGTDTMYVATTNKQFVQTNIPYFDTTDDFLSWARGNTSYANESTLQHKVLSNNAAEKLTDAFDDTKVYTPDSLDRVNTRIKNNAIAVPLGGTPKENTDEYENAISNSIAQSIATDIAESGNGSGDDEDNKLYIGIKGLFEWLADNILAAILAAITMVASQIWEFFSAPVNAIKSFLESISSAVLGIPSTLSDLKDAVLDFPISEINSYLKDLVLGIPIVDDIATKLIDIRDYLYGILQNSLVSYDGDFLNDNNGIVAFSNGLYLLILILFMLLRLFLHVLEFIFFIFRIPASTSLMPEYLLMGFNYLNEIHLPVLNISLYALLQGLLYVVVFFGILGTLRSYVSRMKAPKS